MHGSQWLSNPTVTEGLLGSGNHNCSKQVCASLLPVPLPASIYPIKVVEGMTCLLLSWFHSANPPSAFEGMMDWFETKPSHSQTERFLFTTGNNLKPLEKITCQLCINSFTTRYKGSHNSGGLHLIEFICFHFVNREEGESTVGDS